jgi:hypothetical protein
MQLMKPKWPGFNAKGTVIIDLAPASFCLADDAIVIDGEYFEPKDELHVTVIGTELGLILQEKINSDRTVDRLLTKTFEAIDWSFTQTGPVHLLSRVKDAVVEQSIIMLLEMRGVKEFYAQLKTLGLIDANTPIPPAHVTLYTRNCPYGIGVPSEQVLKLLSVKTLSMYSLNKLCC